VFKGLKVEIGDNQTHVQDGDSEA